MILTREIIEAMQPGRAMDGAVHVLFMGREIEAVAADGGPMRASEPAYWNVPAYSTDKNHASEVAYKLGTVDEVVWDEKGRHTVKVRGLVATGHTFPLAICRAALLTTL